MYFTAPYSSSCGILPELAFYMTLLLMILCNVLEAAIIQVWAGVQAQPESYVMIRVQFAVFDYFQYHFVGQEVAITARKIDWHHIGESGQLESMM
jgi:hypothetical protein